MKRTPQLLLTLALVIAPLPAAHAVTKPIPVLALPTAIDPHLSPSDDIAGVITTPNSAYFVGTLETSTTTIVSQPSLGGASDGYISSLSWSGSINWSMRLGGAGDDIATAVTTDLAGNIWVVGASNIPAATPTPFPTPTNIFNPGHIAITPVSPPTSGLRRLMVWELSPSGAIKASYSSDFLNAIEPATITVTGKGALISGTANDPAGPNFQVTMSTIGKFSRAKFLTAPRVKASAITFIKGTSYIWQSYKTDRSIPGIVGFKPLTATSVLIRSSAKTGKIADLYTLAGDLAFAHYEKGVGIVLVTLGESGYGINFIKTL